MCISFSVFKCNSEFMCNKMQQMSNNYSSADRFISRRVGSNLEASNYFLKQKASENRDLDIVTDTHSKFVNYAYLNWKKKMFRDRLWSTLVGPKSQNVLNISYPSQNLKSIACSQLWPVHARKKPLIGEPNVILDMPNMESNLCYNVADWGSTGYLASIFEQEIYLWHPNSKNPVPVTQTGGRVEKCVRWNRSAALFATALDRKGIAIWHLEKNQILYECFCVCPSACVVTCLEWSSSNNLVSGCGKGRLSVWSTQLELLQTIDCAHSGSIITIAFSCTDRYLATTATDRLVRIWLWKGLKEHFEIEYPSPVRGVAFHPWKETLFAIGGNLGDGSLSIWHAGNHTQIGYKLPPANCDSCCVDNLTWNPLTGELVVSYWQYQEQSRSSIIPGKSFILVLSDLQTVVDEIEWHTGRVLYLMWGDEGTTLATASADENLCMWAFLGNSSDTIKAYKNMIKKKKISTNGIENLNMFNCTIR